MTGFACGEASNCPGVEQLPDGDFAVTGAWRDADGGYAASVEATVVVPADVFHAEVDRLAVHALFALPSRAEIERDATVYTRARVAAQAAFDDAREADDEARRAFHAADADRDAPQAVYVAALGRFQRASERVTQCSAALSALERVVSAGPS